ncbi:MAG: GTPase HflX [Armatimonadetes bacterium]|nr:GTPase HflX [Armatimonadota bacterium]
MTRAAERAKSGRDWAETPQRHANQRVILIGVDGDDGDFARAFDELAALCQTAGAEVVGQIVQRRDTPDPATYIGSGKAQEAADLARDRGADLVIVNAELAPTQQRNLSRTLGVSVIDRTQLILDIFAQRARTHEGKLQVELAQLNYLMPRLAGMWTHLERQAGGIGARGPGESQLESDRRHIARRIQTLKEALKEVSRHRERARSSRQAVPFPVVALVGYSNAGKSTLLNALSGAEVYADDRLFATLDPTTRKVRLPGGWEVLVTDTVGFVSNLPHHLVAAFRATLEEVVEADLLVHVVDASREDWPDQADAVFGVLEQLGADEKPMLTVFNKVDRVADQAGLRRLVAETPHSVGISALNGRGLPALLEGIEEMLAVKMVPVAVLLPYQRGDLVALCYERGRVRVREDRPDGVYLEVDLPQGLAGRVTALASPTPPAEALATR